MNRPIIAITGSSGKTTTKEMLASILERKWKTFKSFQNGNDVWYTTQYAKQLKASHRAVVLKYGMKHAGDIRNLAQRQLAQRSPLIRNMVTGKLLHP